MDASQFESFYHTYVERIYKFVFYRVGGNKELAQDLTQDVFLKALEAFERYDPSLGRSAWIYTIARHHLINQQAKTRPTVDVEEIENTFLVAQDAREDSIHREEDQALLEAVARLSADEARLVRMKYLEGWSFDELAEMFGKTSGALRVQAGRALKKLRSLMRHP